MLDQAQQFIIPLENFRKVRKLNEIKYLNKQAKTLSLTCIRITRAEYIYCFQLLGTHWIR